MSKQYDFVIFMGRFQPAHHAHLNIIREGLNRGKKVILLIGSANIPRTIKNPWTWQEREQMIRGCLSEDDNARLICRGIEDRLYNDQQWVRQVQDVVDNIIRAHDADRAYVNVGLIGHHKDSSSYYLDMFPQWDLIEYPKHEHLNATDIRNVFFNPEVFLQETDRDKMPVFVRNWIQQWSETNEYQHLVEEFFFIENYKAKWANTPYIPTFNTADAVVFQSGHVLLVRRRNAPGRGLWAIPGGFLNPNETLFETALRELREETKLKVPEPVLRGSVIGSKTFDHPNRSLRGRIITKAFAFKLNQLGPLPKVKGSDDADKAKWVTLDEVADMRDQLFEDHADIINHFVGLV